MAGSFGPQPPKRCFQCGTQLPATAQFCLTCGAKQFVETVPPPPVMVPPYHHQQAPIPQRPKSERSKLLVVILAALVVFCLLIRPSNRNDTASHADLSIQPEGLQQSVEGGIGIPPASLTPLRTTSSDLLIAELQQLMPPKIGTTPDIVITGDTAAVLISDGSVIFTDHQFAGQDLLEQFERLSYFTFYTIFEHTDTINTVLITFRVDDTLLYQLDVTRIQAYAYPLDYLDPQQPGLSVAFLAASASDYHLTRTLSTTIHMEGLAQAVQSIDEETLSEAIHDSMAGVDLIEWTQSENHLWMAFDITPSVTTLFDEEGPRKQEWALDHAQIMTIYGMGMMMDRFPSLNSVTIEMHLDGARLTAYKVSRDHFNAMGRDHFMMASSSDDIATVLQGLTEQ